MAPLASDEKRLSPKAERTLNRFVADLRTFLLDSANGFADGDQITDECVERAFKRLSFPTKDQLAIADAHAAVSQAFRENRIIERIAYAMAVVLFVYGLILLSNGIGSDTAAPSFGHLASGTIVELLILVPFRFAVNARRHNIALRMLGLVLNRVDDAKTLAALLKETFAAVVLGQGTFESPAAASKRRRT